MQQAGAAYFTHVAAHSTFLTRFSLHDVCAAQLGHQAVNCTNGTINWRQIYGDEAFRLKPAIFPSDVDRAKKEKEIDVEALERQAREFAQVCPWKPCLLQGASRLTAQGGGGLITTPTAQTCMRLQVVLLLRSEAYTQARVSPHPWICFSRGPCGAQLTACQDQVALPVHRSVR